MTKKQQTAIKLETYLTVQWVADQLQLNIKSIQRYCAQGLFPGAFKTSDGLTSKWRIPQSGFESYLASRSKQVGKK